MRNLFILVTLIAGLLAGGARADSNAPLPREVVVNGVEFVHIPEGWFWYAMENNAWDVAGSPGHPRYRDIKIWLDGYYIAKYEARARDFERYMDSGEVGSRKQYVEAEGDGCTLRRKADGDYYQVDPAKDLPATHLSWDLADGFARWLGFRLPSEMEWTKAARGTDRRMWPWGDEYPDDTFAGYNRKATDCNTVPVDSFPNGRSPYGIYNMAGNVFELVQDWYNDEWDAALKEGARNPPLADRGTTPRPLTQPEKIMKGGRWSSPANGISIHRRNLRRPDEIFICYGTRFAMDEAMMREHLAKGTATVVATAVPTEVANTVAR